MPMQSLKMKDLLINRIYENNGQKMNGPFHGSKEVPKGFKKGALIHSIDLKSSLSG